MPEGLKALMERAGEQRSLPPIEKWDPPFCGDLDMQIKRDGSWYYMGTPIRREALSRLFSSVLKREEDGKYYLVTPVEKVGLTVEDAPFVIVEMENVKRPEGPTLILRSNMGDVVEAGAQHPLRFSADTKDGGFKPYVRIRGNLDGLFNRQLAQQLAEFIEERNIDGALQIGIESGGQFFPIEIEGEGRS
ncbi:DUF1285 domain-containing protein [Rhodobacteraceae bacterium RKSG542]|uniref:DUF1285 domain-containing protein n=1 Tax=Pseudovibrio flavus TaxID=2529854 RepID=UPI0012BBFAE1|nr:DUF1285 domain-containing protein [Pseudovibrio flavus]MTI18994.1 DUF1285 domain-containing protein [Pseudovibrio flavus]